MKKCTDTFNIKINFIPEEEEISKVINQLNKFGCICTDNDLLFDSLIINKNKEYVDNIITWLNKNNKIMAELLYRKTRDGDSIDTFHELCDNKKNTLILAKTNDGIIIGGYTPLNWDDHSGYKQDNDTFIFSLTNNCISKKKKIEKSINCSKYIGPSSCCFGIGNTKKSNMSQGKFDLTCSFYEDFNKIIPNNKAGTLEVAEVEIYKLTFK